MPTSSTEGKDWLLSRIVAERPRVLLDVGAGDGTYARLLTPHLPDTLLFAIEVFEPYVAEYELHRLYDKVIVTDARTCRLPAVDVVMLGDVLEHMTRNEAVALWVKARQAARRVVFASIPLGEHPQGAVNGNEHERHRHSWTDETVHRDLDGIAVSWTGQIIGCYAAPGLNER